MMPKIVYSILLSVILLSSLHAFGKTQVPSGEQFLTLINLKDYDLY